MATQLTFDLPSAPALGRDAFFIGPSNAVAFALLDASDQWDLGKMMLVGPEKSGKTHLAHVWADQTNATLVQAADLPRAKIGQLATAGHVVVEDIHRIAGLKEAQDALFHLHNLILAEGGQLLGTGTNAPPSWGITLPDLASRIEGTPVAELLPPDDQLLEVVMVKLFHDRQLTPAPAVIGYLINRMERSFQAVGAVVNEMDRLSLQRGKAITRAIAAQALDNLGMGSA